MSEWLHLLVCALTGLVGGYLASVCGEGYFTAGIVSYWGALNYYKQEK